MELFTRDLVLAGPPIDVRTWAGEIAEAWTAATAQQIDVWISMAGTQAGQYTWATPMDGIGELQELSTKALGDAAYLAKLEEGRSFITEAPRDALMRPYFNEVPTGNTQMGSVASVTRATSRAGSLGHAVGWGQELAEYSKQVTGIPMVLYGTVAGSFSELVWVAVTDDARAADEMDRTLKADDEYRKLIGRGGGYFMSGSARTSMHVRIA